MPRINTALTRLLNVDLPILCAPMAFASEADLASAVTAASAFGFIGAGFTSSAQLKSSFQVVRQKLNIAEGSPVPVGIGFVGWILAMTEISDDPRLEAILEEKPVAIWFAFGDNLGKYIAQVRAYDEKREHKTTVFVMTHSVEGALRAANEWEVDVIVAQGVEAGGHGSSEAPPLLTLFPAVKRALPDGPLIVAAGGISTGEQIAALLTLGADGVVLGTRFLFTHECIYSSAQKEVLVRSGLNSTVRTLAFDEVGRTNFWPPKHDGRAVTNNIIRDVEEGLSLEERLKRFDESAASGDTSRLIIWAGVGTGLTNSITSARVRSVDLSYVFLTDLRALQGCRSRISHDSEERFIVDRKVVKFCPSLEGLSPPELIVECGRCGLFDIRCCMHPTLPGRKTCHHSRLVLTDGACSNNGQPGAKSGLGVVLGSVEEYGWSIPVDDSMDPGNPRTSQRAELLAAITGIQLLLEYAEKSGESQSDRSRIVVGTDSEYVVKGMTDWFPTWRSRGWRNAQDKRPANLDLFMKLDDITTEVERSGTVVGFWHISREYNEIADGLAKQAAHQISN
ncbi:hypothetical protein H0H93_003635 [Arthromyces matolae]|nr:hypothetical protein H0H93_003635 [Arthromyces matolae]